MTRMRNNYKILSGKIPHNLDDISYGGDMTLIEILD
jgi:hypothetical protein